METGEVTEEYSRRILSASVERAARLCLFHLVIDEHPAHYICVSTTGEYDFPSREIDTLTKTELRQRHVFRIEHHRSGSL